jgi:UDP-N-acetylglucosamine acyltransferase
MIHKTAIIHPDAEIGKGVSIGPYSIIKGNVKIKNNTIIESHVVIESFTEIGENCRIFQFASIGGIPQDLKFKGEESYLIIGNNNIIREFVTINRGTKGGGGVTRIGDGNLIMAYTHIAHDCNIGDNVILANCATLAGHIIIEDYAIIGGLVPIQQFVRIGAHAYIGGLTGIIKDVPPYTISSASSSGNRARLFGINVIGLRRRGFPSKIIEDLKKCYRITFKSGLTIKNAIDRIKKEIEPSKEVSHFIEFIESSRIGVVRGGDEKD